MTKLSKRVLSLMLFLALLCSVSVISPAQTASAATIDTGYTDKANAYNWGTYSNYKYVSTTMPETDTDKWYQFTLPAGSRIYIRCSYSNRMEGCSIELFRGSVRESIKTSPSDVLTASSGITQFMALNIDNTTNATQTYYIHFNRGSQATGVLYYTLTMYERIRSGNGTFDFSSMAKNSGSPVGSTIGSDSNVLSINLTNNTKIPPKAIVSHVTTSGTMSPSQGNVHHKIMPQTKGFWYTSSVASASSGYYDIVASDKVPVAQQWSFCYNVVSPKASTMQNVKLKFDWEYDLSDNNYEIY